MKGAKSRTVIIAGGGFLVALFLLYAYWPRAVQVDIGEAARGTMLLTIDEEARTRVRNSYMVSAPVAGRLLRVQVEPGDFVEGGRSIIAMMAPAFPTVLDVRTEEQAKAAVEAAEAAVALARADASSAAAAAELAKREVDRARALAKDGTISKAALDHAEAAWRSSNAARSAANAAIALREAELENARLLLMAPVEAERRALSNNPHPKEPIPIKAPISGQVLRVLQESETVTAAGAPILEIGDPRGDLEIIAELLSTDAVQVSAGDRVIIDKWGGDAALAGVVERVEPWGFTKFSALGVEEQRVNAIIRFSGEEAERAALGHGFRVEVRIIIWEAEDALRAPASALFRSNGAWAVFKIAKGRAVVTPVEVGKNNGVEAEILSGLTDGDRIILYPSGQISNGVRVDARRLK